jgi:type II secretion system protein G
MRKLKFTQGFTLIELITVMVIILIIAGLMIGVGGSAREAAKKRKAEVMIGSLEVAISMYDADTGQYPPDNEQTSSCESLYDHLINENHRPDDDGTITPPEIAGWRGPYMEFNDRDLNIGQTAIVDPWGNAYEYAVGPATGNTNSFNLWSYGPDGPTGTTGDDIYNW